MIEKDSVVKGVLRGNPDMLLGAAEREKMSLDRDYSSGRTLENRGVCTII